MRITGPVDAGTPVVIRICCAENQCFSGYAGPSRLRTLLEGGVISIDDAGWDTDFVYDVPADLPSGVYAARLRGGDDEEDYIPFAVRPSAGAPRAKILFVLPTFMYMAYANERFHDQDFVQWDLASDHPLRLSPQDAFVAENAAMLSPSTYDAHTDGSYC